MNLHRSVLASPTRHFSPILSSLPQALPGACSHAPAHCSNVMSTGNVSDTELASGTLSQVSASDSNVRQVLLTTMPAIDFVSPCTAAATTEATLRRESCRREWRLCSACAPASSSNSSRRTQHLPRCALTAASEKASMAADCHRTDGCLQDTASRPEMRSHQKGHGRARRISARSAVLMSRRVLEGTCLAHQWTSTDGRRGDLSTTRKRCGTSAK